MSKDKGPAVKSIRATDAREDWDKVLLAVFRKEAWVIVEKDGKPVAALVSMDDLDYLTSLIQSASPDAPALSEADFEAAQTANRAEAEKTRALLAPPSPEEIERRKAVVARIKANWPYGDIAPSTTADLIHEARAEEESAYGKRA